MEKIALVIDPRGIDNPSLQYAVYLAQLTNSKLTGIFLRGEPAAVTPESRRETSHLSGKDVVHQTIELQHTYPSSESSKKQFTSYNASHGFVVPPEILEAENKEQVIRESRFLDLLVVCAKSSFDSSIDAVPSGLTEYMLRHSECPVLIAPINFNEPDEIVFAYDGSASSVFAIKEFTHLFPQFEDRKVTFLEVNKSETNEIENQKKITDYLKMHYSMIGYQVLHGDPKDELFSYFIGKRNPMIVMGAFGRNIISNLFNRSAAHLLLKTTTLPVFITHK